jgi:predicted nucleic acid-binding protein
MQRSDDIRKRSIARQTINDYDCVTSTQVLNEVCNVFTKKYPIPVESLGLIVKSIVKTAEVAIVSPTTIDLALGIHKDYRYSYYDALIIASALEKKCVCLFTEDMQDEQIIYETLTIVNIFKK